jgi:two-component system chemotaxis response regulator CheY
LVGPVSLTPKELAECQKYASVDLIKGFKEYLQAQESKNEGAFIDTFVSADIGSIEEFAKDDVLFSAGETASKGFLLISGSVLIQTTAGNWYSLQPMVFLGFEVMQPDGAFALSCKAQTNIKCLVIGQDDVMNELSDELSGSLTRMAFKTRDMILRTIETDAKSKTKRRRSLGFSPASAELKVDAVKPLMRVPILVSDDNEEFRRVIAQVLNNLGCVAKADDYDKQNLEAHLNATKFSATVTELHKVDSGNPVITSITGRITVCMPANPDHNSLQADFDGKKVLVVDDVSLVRKMVSKIINNIGFECEFAENGFIACDKLSREPEKYVAVILDLRMPVKDGYETLTAIRDDFKLEMPVIMLIGESDNSSVCEKLLGMGANEVLHKPADASDFTKAFITAGLLSPFTN